MVYNALNYIEYQIMKNRDATWKILHHDGNCLVHLSSYSRYSDPPGVAQK
ncbi:hypothetical protein [Methanospirillum sp.]|nr:hypothetical protein [Methanospirillum sp.]